MAQALSGYRHAPEKSLLPKISLAFAATRLEPPRLWSVESVSNQRRSLCARSCLVSLPPPVWLWLFRPWPRTSMWAAVASALNLIPAVATTIGAATVTAPMALLGTNGSSAAAPPSFGAAMARSARSSAAATKPAFGKLLRQRPPTRGRCRLAPSGAEAVPSGTSNIRCRVRGTHSCHARCQPSTNNERRLGHASSSRTASDWCAGRSGRRILHHSRHALSCLRAGDGGPCSDGRAFAFPLMDTGTRPGGVAWSDAAPAGSLFLDYIDLLRRRALHRCCARTLTLERLTGRSLKGHAR